MTTAWVLNIVGLLLVTVGALLSFLSLRNAAQFVPELSTPEAKRAFEKYQRKSAAVMGLLAAWLVLQYVGMLI